MRITAALVREKGAPFRLETLHLADPGPDEVVVRVAACGVCQTDVHGRDDYFGIPFPCVFGHEGAGVVERIGARVTKVEVGDCVVMASPSCGKCSACRRGLPGYCAEARRIKFGGRLRDGRPPYAESVSGAFFQQSAFATHALATEGNVVKLPDDLPHEVAAAFACGVNTGAGAVLNVLKPAPGSSIAVFGAGSVGLAAVMAARIAGCATICAIDLHENRLALAREVGLSRSALAQRFSDFLDQPPMQYLAQWRLLVAAQQLRDGAAPITDVASDAGYESEAAFNRAFKREFGLPPAGWRRKERRTSGRASIDV